jgi:hypothetical protein
MMDKLAIAHLTSTKLMGVKTHAYSRLVVIQSVLPMNRKHFRPRLYVTAFRPYSDQ